MGEHLDFASCLINTITKCASFSGYERDDACIASTLHIVTLEAFTRLVMVHFDQNTSRIAAFAKKISRAQEYACLRLSRGVDTDTAHPPHVLTLMDSDPQHEQCPTPPP